MIVSRRRGLVISTELRKSLFDDFEGSDAKKALKGWKNARWDRTEKTGFSQFLGRYGRGRLDPYKEYKVPRDADKVTFEIDFYEIDTWDGGSDDITVYVDGEKIDLGGFSFRVDEGTFSGSTTHGITWRCSSLTRPTQLGFLQGYADQKHRIKIEVHRLLA
jgi:hypothetical protein